MSTKTISEPKVQEPSTYEILHCMKTNNIGAHNCARTAENLNDTKSEINRRLGMPIIIPLLALISCFVLKSRREGKISGMVNKYIYFFIALTIIIVSEIAVRYSGVSLKITLIYYFIHISLSEFSFDVLSLSTNFSPEGRK